MNNEVNINNTLDEIPTPKNNAKTIVGLIKNEGKITGYKLSDNSKVSRDEAVNMALKGMISGVAIAHNGDTKYLKSIPNGCENDNLGNLPSISE